MVSMDLIGWLSVVSYLLVSYLEHNPSRSDTGAKRLGGDAPASVQEKARVPDTNHLLLLASTHLMNDNLNLSDSWGCRGLGSSGDL